MPFFAIFQSVSFATLFSGGDHVGDTRLGRFAAGARLSHPIGFSAFQQQAYSSTILFDTPTISDALNRLYALDSGIQCLTTADHLCGFVCTVHVYPGDNLMIHKMLDIAGPGDVIVINAHGGTGAVANAVLGGIICTKAKHRGIANFIVDGLIRDLPGILEVGLPVFARGTTPVGPLHRGPGEINFPIACGGVVINPGDVVVADRTGVVAIPQCAVPKLVERLRRCADQSKTYQDAVARGEFSNVWVNLLLNRSGCLMDGRSHPVEREAS